MGLVNQLTSDPSALLLCAGVIFAILILLIQLIYVIKILPKKTGAGEDKELIDRVIDSISCQEEEELMRDQQLVAVITAALQAYIDTEVPADQLIVRSIRKIR